MVTEKGSNPRISNILYSSVAVTETANKALTTLVSKGAITAPVAVAECEISVERPVPLPPFFDSESKDDTELPFCCTKKEDGTSKSDIVVGHSKLQRAPKYTTLPKPMSRQAAAARARGNGVWGIQTPQQRLPLVCSGSESVSQRAATAKLLFHLHVSGTRLQGLSCSGRDSNRVKMRGHKGQKSGIFFPPLLFRRRQITENNASQWGHLTLGRQHGSFEALLWTSSGTSEPHEHSRWQGSRSTHAQGHWKALGYGSVVGYPCMTVCIPSKSPYKLITWEIPLNTAGKYLIPGINMAARPVHTAVL